MTPPSRYSDQWLERLPYLARVSAAADLGLRPGDTVLMTTAHPDDETFAAGATIASLAQLGVYVHVFCLTTGEAAVDHLALHIPDLARRRVQELTRACRALGVEFSLANLPDGRLDQFAEQVADSVRATVAMVKPQQIFTVWSQDPHPDHGVVGNAAQLVGAEHRCPVTAFPIWAQHWSDPRPAMLREKFAVVANPASASSRREQAVAAYRTQCEPLQDDLDAVLPAWFLRWSTELAVFT